jgi:cyclophilin family peptidyl-prolyl cis-trans isomerase
MKRRLEGLAASTSSKAKKRSWKDDDDKKPAAKASKAVDHSDSDLDELAAAAAKEQKENADQPYVANPVVWMDISVAGKPRGKVFFELFRDTEPEAVTLFHQLCAGPFKGTELHKIVPRSFAEGGDIDVPASTLDDAGRAAASRRSDLPAMRHTKAGLLSCKAPGPNGLMNMIFQVTMAPAPELDTSQIVFGQLVAGPVEDTDAARVHALHWVSSAGNAAGTPRDTVLLEDCGHCDAAAAERLTGQPQLLEPPYPPPESQEERYSRAGFALSRLSDSLSATNLSDAVDLTEDLIDYLEWTSQKAKKEGGGGGTRMYRSAEIETELKELRGVLENAEHKAGEVVGFENQIGRSVKSQLNRIKDLGEILNRVF